MSERPGIALDFDDTLMPTREAIIDLLNAVHGTSVDAGECREFSPRKLWNLEREEYLRFFTDHQEKIHTRLPYEGVKGTLAAWAKVADLYVVTARPASWKGSAEPWLERENIPVRGVWYTDGGGGKAEWARARGVRFLVEDRVDYSTPVANAGVPVILLDRPYNRELSHPLIHRVMDWQEAKQKVAEMRYLADVCEVVY